MKHEFFSHEVQLFLILTNWVLKRLTFYNFRVISSSQRGDLLCYLFRLLKKKKKNENF